MKLQITNYKLQTNHKFQPRRYWNFLVICCLVFGISDALPVRAETPADIAKLLEVRQQQIADLEGQIADYWKSVDEKRAKGDSVQSDIEVLKTKIAKSELEIRSLQLAIEESKYKLKKTEAKIGEVTGQLGLMKGKMAASLRELQQREGVSTFLRFAETDKLSDIFLALGELEQLYQGLDEVLGGLKSKKSDLEEVRDAVAEERRTQERLKAIEESQKEIVARRKTSQAKLLVQIEKEKGKLLSTIVSRKQDLDAIKAQIEYLQKAGVSAEEAVRFGQLAAIRTGIRTSFLIAVLEVESRLGLNVGKGNWKTDMHSRDKDAFVAITGKLGLNPDTTPVSRAPSYGWGGAMGPAQFLPNTWLGYESSVAKLTGHNPPNPWNIEDAFTAAALMLARNGASSKTRAGEIRASKTYISGNGNCAKNICNSYSNLIQDKADDIEEDLKQNGNS